MKISDMEKRSGVSAKTIRYYEEKQLLQIKRSENSYREYSEDDLRTLKLIVILRKCGCSIASIHDVWTQQKKLQELLMERMEKMESEETERQIRLAIMKDMHKQLSKTDALDIDEWLLSLEEIETDEFQQFHDDTRMLSQHSLFYYVIMTLILSGPIFTLLFRIVDKIYTHMIPLALTSLFCMVLITLEWCQYMKHRHQHKDRKKGGWILLIIIPCVLISTLLCFVGISWLRETLFVHDGWLMWSSPDLSNMLPFLFEIEVLIIAGAVLAERFGNIDFDHFHILFVFMKRHCIWIIIMNLMVLYISVFQINVIYEDHMETMRWYAPFMESDTLNDIDHVESGFRGSFLSIAGENQGDFYYYIHLKNGRKIDLSQPNPPADPRYEQHTYLEIEEYDTLLMDAGIRKESSMAHFEDNDLAREYRQRFKRIVNNKP